MNVILTSTISIQYVLGDLDIISVKLYCKHFSYSSSQWYVGW